MKKKSEIDTENQMVTSEVQKEHIITIPPTEKNEKIFSHLLLMVYIMGGIERFVYPRYRRIIEILYRYYTDFRNFLPLKLFNFNISEIL